MKKLFGIALIILACMASDSRAVASDGAAACSETKYGTGRPISGGNYELDVDTISKCDKPIKIYANYSWEGKDGDGNACSGSRLRQYVMHIQPKKAATGHVTVYQCVKVERAWIDDIIVEFF